MTTTNVIDWPKVPPNPIQRPVSPPEGQPVAPTVLIKLYEHTVAWQHHELQRKNYEVEKMRGLVYAYHAELEKLREGQPNSAYEVLRMFANDPAQPAPLRLRAAEACVQYERPKLTASYNQNRTVSDIGSRMEAAKQRLIEQERIAIAPDRPVWPAGPDAA
jgi:hypothetical protein